ncbi:mevalonate kinase [Patescibacteria group bacterium]
MANKITASAPGKLMLFGEHAVVYGHPCIVTAVDQRLFVTVEKNGKDAFHLSAPDLGLTAYSKTINDLGGEGLPKAVRFIETFYKRFLEKFPQNEGIDVTTKSEFSSDFGFGSSSAATVAFAKALMSLYKIEISNKELFDLCYATVIEVQGVGSGFDVAAAIYGGTVYYVTPGKVIERVFEGELPLEVGYTGIKADTPTLVRQVAEHKRKHPRTIGALFSQIERITKKAKKALKSSNFNLLGKLMNENQELLGELGVSSVELDQLNEVCLRSGSKGAKLSGAGGGDCMIAVVDDNKNEIIEGIKKNGEYLDVVLGAEGVRVE